MVFYDSLCFPYNKQYHKVRIDARAQRGFGFRLPRLQSRSPISESAGSDCSEVTMPWPSFSSCPASA